MQIYAWVVVAFTIAPIVVVFGMSVNPHMYFAFPPDGFSMHWFAEAIQNSLWREAFTNSAKLAALTACGATAIGVVSALALHRATFRMKPALAWWFVAPMLIPQLLLGFALLVLLTRSGIGASWWGLFAAHLLVTFPFVVRLVFAGLPALTASVEEAAATLGADQLKIFRTVTIPILRPAIFAGWLFAFILSFDNLMVSLFLASPREPMLPVTILSVVTYSGDPTIAAVSALFILLSLAMMILLDRTVGLRFEGTTTVKAD
jgi:putative spermidine/putrescine transport system permease protein